MAESVKAKPAEEDKSTPAKAEQVVKYVGTANQRRISKSSWESAGVEDQGDVSWNARNGFQVPTKELSKGALAYLETDAGFKL